MTTEMGKPTKKLIGKAIGHLSQKLGLNPAFISVRTRDMKKDIVMDTKVPNTRVEYFLLIFNGYQLKQKTSCYVKKVAQRLNSS